MKKNQFLTSSSSCNIGDVEEGILNSRESERGDS